MDATLNRSGVGTAALPSGYANMATTVVRRSRSVWAIAAVDLLAVVFAIGAVQAINGMIFRTPAPADVATADESDAVQVVASNAANFGVLPSPSGEIARLVSAARVAIAMPDDRVLFAEPSPFEGGFGGNVGAPGTGSFAAGSGVGSGSSAGRAIDVSEGGSRPASGTPGGRSPRTDEPQTPPPLLVYVPLPPAASEPVTRVASQPPVNEVMNLAERATGPPLDLTPAVALDVDVELGGGSSGTSPAATMVISSGVDSSIQSVATTAVQVTSSASGGLGATVSETIGSVGGLLR